MSGDGAQDRVESIVVSLLVHPPTKPFLQISVNLLYSSSHLLVIKSLSLLLLSILKGVHSSLVIYGIPFCKLSLQLNIAFFVVVSHCFIKLSNSSSQESDSNGTLIFPLESLVPIPL